VSMIRNCTRRTALALLATLACVGCGGSDHPDTIPVSGRLTYGGGDWPNPGVIYFTALEPAEGFPRRAGTANFGIDGQFQVKTWQEGDGLMPGKYRISVECWKFPPKLGGPASVSYVPIEMQVASRSKWEIEVAVDGEAVEIERDIPKP
jgi:hypothetical protein